MSKATDILDLVTRTFEASGRYSYSLEDVKKLVKSVWLKIRKTVHKRFNDGKPTCTFATYEVGKVLKQNKISFRIASGDYKGVGHWWIVVYAPDENGDTKKWIVDLGNNIDSKAIEIGKITPVNCKPYSSATNYTPESFMNFKEATPLISKY